MTITLKTHKLLWGFSGNTCAKCKSSLFEDATLTDDISLVGEEAHIASKQPNGPRYDDPLPIERRDLFENLLLLCNRCHKIVDEQTNAYTADSLRTMKVDHETAVRTAFSQENSRKIEDDATYAEYIQTWEESVDLAHWEVWTSYLLGADAPSMRVELCNNLRGINEYLLKRVWPCRYPDLENAIKNFRSVLNDLLFEFSKHAEVVEHEERILVTEKFYKSTRWLEETEFQRRVSQYETHTDFVRDLTLELTRAANLVCDLVRRNISSRYRLIEGKLTASLGPFSDFSYRTFVPEYSESERSSLYRGISLFQVDRFSRDRFCGTEPESES